MPLGKVKVLFSSMVIAEDLPEHCLEAFPEHSKFSE
jgi:hypothetical protein